MSQLMILVQGQLQAGHIEPSTSPWNTPVFVIPKKSGRWRLLQDLRAINEVMEPMGPLQQGLPTPTMIPVSWAMIIIDLKDCFFTIPLARQDREKFAFSVPVKNNQQPVARYQWVVLPQGMKNSPMICQHYVHQALLPICNQFPAALIIHYMDDIAVAHAPTHTPALCSRTGSPHPFSAWSVLAPIQGEPLCLGTRSRPFHQLKHIISAPSPIPPASSVFPHLLNHSHKHTNMLLLFPS